MLKIQYEVVRQEDLGECICLSARPAAGKIRETFRKDRFSNLIIDPYQKNEITF